MTNLSGDWLPFSARVIQVAAQDTKNSGDVLCRVQRLNSLVQTCCTDDAVACAGAHLLRALAQRGCKTTERASLPIPARACCELLRCFAQHARPVGDALLNSVLKLQRESSAWATRLSATALTVVIFNDTHHTPTVIGALRERLARDATASVRALAMATIRAIFDTTALTYGPDRSQKVRRH